MKRKISSEVRFRAPGLCRLPRFVSLSDSLSGSCPLELVSGEGVGVGSVRFAEKVQPCTDEMTPVRESSAWLGFVQVH